MTFLLFRQSFLGFVLVAFSLPILLAAHRAFGLDSPPTSGVLLLGASVIFAFATGGAIGFLIGQSRRGDGKSATLLSILVGLIWGGVLCAIVAPIYAQSVFDALTREAASELWGRRNALGEGREYVIGQSVESAKALAWNGAARLPALSLLVWTLLGPALSGAIEARLAARR